jgi:hypothetical protein
VFVRGTARREAFRYVSVRDMGSIQRDATHRAEGVSGAWSTLVE